MTHPRDILTECLSLPHEFGKHDCALFAGEIVYAATGRQDIRKFVDGLRGEYKDLKGAMIKLEAALKKKKVKRPKGMHPLESMCNHFFGKSIAPLQACRYDVVLGDWGKSLTLGIKDGYRIVAISDDGLIRFDIKYAKKAWHINV